MCHPNDVANVVAIASSTQQHEADVDQPAAARADSTVVDMAMAPPVTDAMHEGHPGPAVEMRMGEAFSRLCHCSVPLGPFVGKIAAPLRTVSRKFPGAQRALDRCMSVVGQRLRLRSLVCKTLAGLPVPDGECVSESAAG